MEFICGIDEAGRGAIAGPVTAAAVILPTFFPYSILDDSKALSILKRENAAKIIIDQAIEYAIGWVWPSEIDIINIHYASLLAMKRAFSLLTVKPDLVIVDGKFIPRIENKTVAIVKGDIKIREIQAASIMAKTARDSLMIRYSCILPSYGFERHKGYPTPNHKKKCREFGLSHIHRKSFKTF